MGRDAEGEINNHMLIARTKTEEKHLTERPSFRKRKIRLDILLTLLRKTKTKTIWKKISKLKIQTAISGIEYTVETNPGIIVIRKFISEPLFQTEKKAGREPTINKSGRTGPKNRHCLRGLDGKYIRWDEIVVDIIRGKLKKRSDSESEGDDDNEDDEDLPQETGTPKVYDTYEGDRRYATIRTNPEEDAIQTHADGEISGESL